MPLATHGHRPVSSDEKIAFEERGFHVLRGALAPEEVASYREVLQRLLLTPADHPYARLLAATELSPCPPDNPRGVWAGFDLPLFDERFYDLAFHPAISLTPGSERAAALRGDRHAGRARRTALPALSGIGGTMERRKRLERTQV